MRRAVLERARMLGARCREMLSDLRYRWDGGQLIIAAVVTAFAAAIATIVFVAYTATTERMAEQQRRVEIRCLAVNVYHEARGEPRLGQVAVAEVTMNRVASPQFPDSVCRVVRQDSAFSWTMSKRTSRPTGQARQQALKVAAGVYAGEQSPVVPGALHYHARGVDPAWARGRTPIRTIGRHIFYP